MCLNETCLYNIVVIPRFGSTVDPETKLLIDVTVNAIIKRYKAFRFYGVMRVCAKR